MRILRCFLPATLALARGGVDITDEPGVRAGKEAGVSRVSGRVGIVGVQGLADSLASHLRFERTA